MKPETLGEVNILFQNLMTKFDDLSHKIDENTKVTNQVLVQATKTNGRVNLIEPLALDYQEKRAQARGAVFIIALVGASALTIGGFATNSYINYKTKQITSSVVQELEKNYQVEIKQ